ncbi:MAG: TM1812 family CRISPR-associated protein [Hydrogenimonas sp.]|nr:TM1812 family CRISPR-associated protein [Hydrogenimonas sp.]
MRLIATLGATPPKYRHSYQIENKKYETYFSFEAIKAHFSIDKKDVTLIGTHKTKEVLGEYIGSYVFVEVNENSLDEVFKVTIEQTQEGDVVDLTQSFRSLSFGALLGLSFSKSLSKRPKDIYYAQIDESGCNPSLKPCSFVFVSLKKYDEMTDMARTVNTFLATLLVVDDVVIDDALYAEFISHLHSLSAAIFDNHFDKAIEHAKQLSEWIKNNKNESSFAFLQSHLEALAKELHKILSCYKEHESQRLLFWSEFLLSKDITLHAITTLYESIVAFLDEELKIEECNHYVDKRGKKREAGIYQRRNCLKKKMDDCMKVKIPECKKLSEILYNVDKLRNISAHAFSNAKTSKDIASQISSAIKSLKEIYPKRYSAKNGADKLKAVFSDR